MKLSTINLLIPVSGDSRGKVEGTLHSAQISKFQIGESPLDWSKRLAAIQSLDEGGFALLLKKISELHTFHYPSLIIMHVKCTPKDLLNGRSQKAFSIRIEKS